MTELEAAGTSPTDDGLVGDFDTLVSVVEARYAYPDRMSSWSEAVERLRPRVEVVEQRAGFLALLEELLESLHDHHVHLGVNGDASPRLVPSQTDLWVEWVDGAARVTSVRRASDAERSGIIAGDHIVELRGEPVADAARRRLHLAEEQSLEKCDADVVGWALRVLVAGRRDQPRALTVDGEAGRRDVLLGVDWSPAREGVLHAERLEETGDTEVGLIRLHNSLGDSNTINAFDAAIDELCDTDALILDLRETPGGGNTTVARALLGHFVDERTPYQRHHLIEETRVTGVPRTWLEEVTPRGSASYDGEVMVLVGRWTGSMGEGLAMGFDAIGATVLGGPMAGLLGALTEVQLPHTGWVARFAYEALSHVDGTARESWVAATPADSVVPVGAADSLLSAALALLNEADRH